MSFFAILIALLLEQARPLAFDNPVHGGLRGWARTVRRNLDAGQSSHGWVAWLLAVGVPSLLAGLIYWGLWQFSSVLAFVWVVCILYVTLGFRQFSHHFSEIRHALDEGDETQARVQLARWLRVDVGSRVKRGQVLARSALAPEQAFHTPAQSGFASTGDGWHSYGRPLGAATLNVAQTLADASKAGLTKVGFVSQPETP